MSLLVVGSIGIDTVITPTARREAILGGSAVYFALAASYFTPVTIVGVVGDDFPDEHRKLLQRHNVDLSGLETAPGKTFRWTGKYHQNMNDRDTLDVQLNVFGAFVPKVPPAARAFDFLFLANIVPAQQHDVLKQMTRRPRFVAADTMNLWIQNARADLDKLIADVDALVLNDSEARMYTGEHELIRAGRAVLARGPRTVIIKKGEHGALVISKDGTFHVPAYPLDEVLDPTGAGDSFAGAFMGCLAARGTVTADEIRRAVAYASVVASFTCQDFSVDALLRTTRAQVDARFKELVEMARIPG